MDPGPPTRISTLAPVFHLAVVDLLRSGMISGGAIFAFLGGLVILYTSLASDALAPGLILARPFFVMASLGFLVLLLGHAVWKPGESRREAFSFLALTGRSAGHVARCLLLNRVLLLTAWFLTLVPLLLLLVALGGLTGNSLATASFILWLFGVCLVCLDWLLRGCLAPWLASLPPLGRQGMSGAILLLGLANAALASKLALAALDHVPSLAGGLPPLWHPLALEALLLALLALLLPLPAEDTTPRESAPGGHPDDPAIIQRDRPTRDDFMVWKDGQPGPFAPGARVVLLLGLAIWCRQFPPSVGLALIGAFACLGMLIDGVRAAHRYFWWERQEGNLEALLLLPTPPGIFVQQKLSMHHFLEQAWFWTAATAAIVLTLEDSGLLSLFLPLQIAAKLFALMMARNLVRRWNYRLMKDAVCASESFAAVVARRLFSLALIAVAIAFLLLVVSRLAILMPLALFIWWRTPATESFFNCGYPARLTELINAVEDNRVDAADGKGLIRLDQPAAAAGA